MILELYKLTEKIWCITDRKRLHVRIISIIYRLDKNEQKKMGIDLEVDVFMMFPLSKRLLDQIANIIESILEEKQELLIQAWSYR